MFSVDDSFYYDVPLSVIPVTRSPAPIYLRGSKYRSVSVLGEHFMGLKNPAEAKSKWNTPCLVRAVVSDGRLVVRDGCSRLSHSGLYGGHIW